MPNSCVIVPLHNLNLKLNQPLDFGDGLTLSKLPTCVGESGFLKYLGSNDRAALNYATVAFIGGDYEHAVLANLALWLAQPSPACFNYTFSASLIVERWELQQCDRYSPLLCHPNNKNVEISEEDIHQAIALYKILTDLPKENAIWTAVHSTWIALQMALEHVRYLLFWIALEALYGPEDGREITFRLAQRIAFFLGKNASDAENIFKCAKNGYSFRSKVAHGKWKSSPKSNELTAEIENFVRQSLSQILLNPSLKTHFIGKNREGYLDSLVFESNWTK